MKDASCSPDLLFAAALGGRRVHLMGDDSPARALPVRRWSTINASDAALLARCVGPTLDVGCGPGRMTVGLAERGRTALGIDVVPAAVEMARARGASVLLRDVFDEVPAEGRWRTVLLADGNIGIGGDPVRLLARIEQLLRPGGQVVVDVAAPGRRGRVRRVWLSGGGLVSESFPWAVVGVDDIAELVGRVGLRLASTTEHAGRWFVVLAKGRAA